MNTKELIISKLEEVKSLLVKKNEDYGDAALDPVNIFSNQGAETSIRARIDDKLKRIKNSGINEKTEDTLMDLVGYLILLMISRDESNDIQNNLRQGEAASHTHKDSSGEDQVREVWTTNTTNT